MDDLLNWNAKTRAEPRMAERQCAMDGAFGSETRVFAWK